MKLDWQWPGAVVFGLVFVALAVLVLFGKLNPDALLGLVAWLIPSPMQPHKPTVAIDVTPTEKP